MLKFSYDHVENNDTFSILKATMEKEKREKRNEEW